MSSTLAVPVTAIFVGQVAQRWPDKAPSAIAKISVPGPRAVTTIGLQGDAQADLEVHGGAGKAIHHYPADHYALWQAELSGLIDPASPRFRPGGFGENVTTIGLTEESVCIGDIFRWGRATVQISQGRQPCWKLTAHTDVRQMAYLVQKTLRTGWYYRVLDAGQVAPGDLLTLTERPHPGFTVARVTGARLSPRLNAAEARDLAGLESLDIGWREAFRVRAAGVTEDQRPRLEGDV